VIAVSQPEGNSIMYNLTALQAEEFITEVRKHLDVFKNSAEFGWTMVKQDVRKLICIRTNKYNTISSIKSYASALRGSGTICLMIRVNINPYNPVFVHALTHSLTHSISFY
jgi:hypothetical protein